MSKVNTIHIGKAGITDSLIEEIMERLKKHKVVKIRMLRSVMKDKNRRDVAEEVSRKAGAELKNLRGNTFILVKLLL